MEDWPSSVRFLASNEWTVEEKPHRRFRIPGIEARVISSTEHPCHGELGVFTLRAWEKFEIVGEYVGLVRPPTIEGAYVLALQSDLPQSEALSLDAENAGNELRFVNDFRGVAPRANVAFQSTTVNGLPVRMLVVLQDLSYGTELLVDYGRDYWTALATGDDDVASAATGQHLNLKKAAATPPLKFETLDERSARRREQLGQQQQDELSSDDEDQVTSELMAACLDDDVS